LHAIIIFRIFAELKNNKRQFARFKNNNSQDYERK